MFFFTRNEWWLFVSSRQVAQHNDWLVQLSVSSSSSSKESKRGTFSPRKNGDRVESSTRGSITANISRLQREHHRLLLSVLWVPPSQLPHNLRSVSSSFFHQFSNLLREFRDPCIDPFEILLLPVSYCCSVMFEHFLSDKGNSYLELPWFFLGM